jgi:aspartyl protease family protein
MLRFAITVAVGAIFLALVAPDLVSNFVSDAAPARTPAPPVKAEVAQNASVSTSATAETVIDADRGGQYAAIVEINGQPVRMLVDTGATMVVISYETARRLGLQVMSSDYTARVQTATGVAAVAPVTLREVTLGSIYLGEVQALVADRNAGPMELLGMSFLRRLASVEQRSGRLILRQ